MCLVPFHELYQLIYHYACIHEQAIRFVNGFIWLILIRSPDLILVCFPFNYFISFKRSSPLPSPCSLTCFVSFLPSSVCGEAHYPGCMHVATKLLIRIIAIRGLRNFYLKSQPSSRDIAYIVNVCGVRRGLLTVFVNRAGTPKQVG